MPRSAASSSAARAVADRVVDLGLHEPGLAEGDDPRRHERGGDEGKGGGRDPGGVAGTDAADAHHRQSPGPQQRRQAAQALPVARGQRLEPRDAGGEGERSAAGVVVVEAQERLLAQAAHAGVEAGAEGQQAPDDGLRLVKDAELRADPLGQGRPVALVERARVALPVQHPDRLVDLGEREHVPDVGRAARGSSAGTMARPARSISAFGSAKAEVDRSAWSTRVRPRRSPRSRMGPVLLREEDAAVLALPAPHHDERGLEAAGALLEDQGREDGLDDEFHLAPGDLLGQVVEVPRDHQVAHVHARRGQALAEAGDHRPVDLEHAVGLVLLLGDDAEAERRARPLSECVGRGDERERHRGENATR